MGRSVRHRLGWLRQRVGDGAAQMQLLSFLPLFILIAWWSGREAVLFVVSFMFPLLLALQELVRPDHDAGAAVAAAVTDPPDAGTGPEGLPGREAALAHLDGLLARARDSGQVTALLLFDLNGFRHVNLRHGPATGDAALAAIATRLRATLRGDDLLARSGGDRFAVVMAPVRRADFTAALTLAQRVCAAVGQPLVLGETTLRLSCSAGFCLMGRAPEDGAAAMFAAAETALANAKVAGPGSIRSFSPRMRRAALRLRDLAAEVDAALADGQIRPWFQPQVCTDTGEVTGFEALVRWDHPERGVLAPAEFLPAVDAAGAMLRLGETMLAQALAGLCTWDRTGHAVPAVGVNFATAELRDAGLCERLKWDVDRFDLAPGRLRIEVTETFFGQAADPRVIENLRNLASFGFGIDLDDFGTGHASVANLNRYGVRRIKLDRSLIAGVEDNPDRQRLVTAVLRMAECLGLETVAEGVETLAEQAILAQLGCRHIQGFGAAPPMPLDETLAWLARHATAIGGGSSPGRHRA